MNVYIHGTGILSPAGNSGETDFLVAAPDHTDRLLCREPDYSAYIPPMQLRRMSKAIRMGIGASKICLQEAGLERTDAISVGTAFGCLQDTELFLAKMVAQNEQMLTPTAFIQSTHNTVAGQIALLTGCNGHNLTYAHRGHSFEHAMINAQLYLDDHKDDSILVGGIEELTETSIAVLKRAGIYREEASVASSILSGYAPGSIAGEGAAFFVAGGRPNGKHDLLVRDITTFTTKDAAVALGKVNDFIAAQRMQAGDFDLVMLGLNGDQRSEGFYSRLRESTFPGNSQAAFKHLGGEYPVASSFALGLLTLAAKGDLSPSLILNHQPEQLRRILLVNNFVHHYSCWYLETV